MTTRKGTSVHWLPMVASVVTIGACVLIAGHVVLAALVSARFWIGAGLPHAALVPAAIVVAWLVPLVALAKFAVGMGLGSWADGTRTIQVTIAIAIADPIVWAMTMGSLSHFRLIPLAVLLMHLQNQGMKRLRAEFPAPAPALSDAEVEAHRAARAACHTGIMHWGFLAAAGLVALVLTDSLRVGLSWGPSGEPTLWETWPEVAVVGFLAGVAALVAAGRHLAYLTSEAARHRRASTGTGKG